MTDPKNLPKNLLSNPPIGWHERAEEEMDRQFPPVEVIRGRKNGKSPMPVSDENRERMRDLLTLGENGVLVPSGICSRKGCNRPRDIAPGTYRVTCTYHLRGEDKE